MLLITEILLTWLAVVAAWVGVAVAYFLGRKTADDKAKAELARDTARQHADAAIAEAATLVEMAEKQEEQIGVAKGHAEAARRYAAAAEAAIGEHRRLAETAESHGKINAFRDLNTKLEKRLEGFGNYSRLKESQLWRQYLNQPENKETCDLFCGTFDKIMYLQTNIEINIMALQVVKLSTVKKPWDYETCLKYSIEITADCDKLYSLVPEARYRKYLTSPVYLTK